MQPRASLALLAVTGLLLAGCGGDDAATDPESGPPAASTAEGGWVGDEPEWDAYDGGGGRDAAAAEESLDGVASRGSKDFVADREVPSGPLRAGSVDDNAAYDDFLTYLDRLAGTGIALRPFDARGRVVVSVVGSDGRPAAGEEVVVRSGSEEVATLRTTADGTARFLPGNAGEPVDGSWTFAAGDDTAEAAAGTAADLVVDRPGGADGVVPVDVLFLLDATGSMADEIDRLKGSIDSVAARVAALEGAPDVRFAMTLYRDEGDAFVTRTFDFTSDVAAFRDALAEVRADGGGNYPEAMEEGLAEALTVPQWRPAGEAVQLVFLVADAPPHTERDLQMTYPDAIEEAVARGIKIFPVASSESDDKAEAVFRQLAQATGARFVFLSYGAGGAATGKHTDIESTDYEELALDDLIVRLTAEEIAALTGEGGVVPTPDPSPEPTPQGQ